MKRIMLLLLLGAASLAQAGKVYMYKDASGKTVFSDLPPQNVSNVQQKNLGANVIDTSGYPYEVQQAIKNNPVTLWANNCGVPCDSARSLLKERGIPHTETDPGSSAEQFAAFKKLTGGNSVPVLQVGTRLITMFNAASWSQALSDAGYPRTLPPTLRPVAPAKP